MTERVGPFTLDGVVRAVPGARFYAARGAEGEVGLLQVAFLRPEHVDGEGRGREADRILATTARVMAVRGLSEVAFGATELEDGRIRLHWWLDERDPGSVVGGLSLEVWARAAHDLIHRLIALHEQGARAPLLTEQALRWGPGGGLDWLGLPIAPSPRWAGAGTPPPRSAPDEREAPTEQGDLWRLGQTLVAIAAPAALSEGWLGWLAALRTGGFVDASAAGRAVPELPSIDPSPAATPGAGASPMSWQEEAAIGALAVSWSQPPLPVGESPWSDVGIRRVVDPEPESGVGRAPIRVGLGHGDPPRGPRSSSWTRPLEPSWVAIAFLLVLLVSGTVALWARPLAPSVDPAAVGPSGEGPAPGLEGDGGRPPTPRPR